MHDEIESLVQSMRDGTLPRERWTHAAHLWVGTWHVHHLGMAGALREMPNLIRRYNEMSGVANTDSSGYHETLTVAYLHEIDRVLRELPPATTLDYSIAVVMSSGLADSDWPHRYWSRERLWSVEARRHWVAPDRLALPGADS